MGSLGRLLVLTLLVAVVVAERKKGRRFRRPRPPVQLDIGNDLAQMMNASCLPDDFSTPDLSDCEEKNGEKEQFECLAKSAGFADESGYNQIKSEAFIDGLSSDERWTEMAKSRLGECSFMMQTAADLPADNQGVFMFSCWYKLVKFVCNVQRVAYVVYDINSLEGIGIGVGLAQFAEGNCISSGLKLHKSAEWKECAQDNELSLNFLMKAKQIYNKYIAGSEELEELTPENVAFLGEQLVNFNDTIHCTIQAMGAVTNDGELDFDQMRENINNSRARDYIKTAARGILAHCEKQQQTTADLLASCWVQTQPYACTSVKARNLALSQEAAAGCGAGGGARRGGNRKRNRNNRRG